RGGGGGGGEGGGGGAGGRGGGGGAERHEKDRGEEREAHPSESTAARGLLGLRFELVADAEPRLDERVRRRVAVDLLAEAADEDVDGPVARRVAPAPHPLQRLVARGHAPGPDPERVQATKPGPRPSVSAAPEAPRHH